MVSVVSGFKRIAVLVTVLVMGASSTMAQRARAQQVTQPTSLDVAVALIRDGRVAEAEQKLDALLKREPKNAGALNLLGTIRAQQNRLAEAEALWTRAVASDPQFAGPHMNLAYLYLLKGAPEKTIAELKEVVRLEPTNADAAFKLARLLLSQNRIDEGIAFLEGAKASGAPAPLVSLLGDAYLAKGDAAKAEESYTLALASNPSDGAALIGMGQLSLRKGDGPATSSYMLRAKSVIGKSPDLLYRYGVVAMDSGLDDEARAALTEAAALNPKDASVHMMLGLLWLRKPDLLEAEQALRKALDLQPANARAQLNLGYVLLKLKRPDEARVLLEKSVQADSRAPEGSYYLGLIAQDQKDDARAVELLEKVVKQFPEYAYARTALGISFMRLKNFPRAQEELETAVKMNPGDQKAHYNLALLYARLKQPERAQEEMRIVETLKNKGGAQADEDETSAAPAPQ